MSDVAEGPGWWLASDGKWYAPADGPAPTTPPLPVGASPPGPKGQRRWRGLLARDPSELLVAAILGALSFRVLASVVSGIVGWVGAPDETFGRETGAGLVAVGDFGDGQGLLLLLVALLIIWWRAELARGIGYLVWTTALFLVTAAGALVIIVGTVLESTGLGNERDTWYHVIGTGGFALAYAVIGVFAAWGALALRQSRRPPPRVEAASPAPSPVTSPLPGVVLGAGTEEAAGDATP